MGPQDSIRIIGYSSQYARDFARLNYQWIEHYFRIEDEDRAALDHPEAYAIVPGGEIFFVLQGEHIIGTVALVPKSLQADGSFAAYELAKMAVDPACQGQGIGKRLLAHAIAYARARGVRQIVLSTNDILAPALKVYGDAGFVVKPAAQDERYERSNLFMQLDL
jgi:GNAT superfamily N-acetyltransferase